MSDTEQFLPTQFRMSQDAKIGFSRAGKNSTQLGAGNTLTRIWSDYDQRTFGVSGELMKSSAFGPEAWAAFVQNTIQGSEPFWVKEPISRSHANVPCGPPGDGARTTFPMSFYGSVSDLMVTVDGDYVDEADYTVHETANLLGTGFSTSADDDDNAVACLDKDMLLCGNNTETDMVGFSNWARGCVRLVPSTTLSDQDARPQSTKVSAAATAGEDYVALILVRTTSSRDIFPGVSFYNSGIWDSSDYAASATTVVAADGWTLLSHTATCPGGGADNCIPIAKVASGGTSDPWFVGGFSITRGDYDRIHLPSMAPNLIEFSSAVAANSIVRASGTGYRMARCKSNAAETSWAEISPGHVWPGRLQCIEEMEVSW